MREEEPPTPLRSRDTSQTLIFWLGRRRILPNVSKFVHNWIITFLTHFHFFAKIFLGSRKKYFFVGVRKKFGYVFRFRIACSFEWCYFQSDPGTPSCRLGALKKINRFKDSFEYHLLPFKKIFAIYSAVL